MQGEVFSSTSRRAEEGCTGRQAHQPLLVWKIKQRGAEEELKARLRLYFYAYSHRYPLQLFLLCSFEKRAEGDLKNQNRNSKHADKLTQSVACVHLCRGSSTREVFLNTVPFSSLGGGMNRRHATSKWRGSRELWLLVCYLLTSPGWDPTPSELQSSSPARRAIPSTAPWSQPRK